MRLPFLLSLLPFLANSQNQIPQITNLTTAVDLSAGMLTIEYDVLDAEADTLEIFLEVSDNDGTNFLIDTENATGDIGFPVLPGAGKSISWIYNGRIENPGNYVLKLVADDRFEIDLQELVDQVDSNRLKTDLEFLCGIRHRTTGLAHLEEVKDSMEQFFLENNLQTERQAFPFGAYQAHNMIARKPGAVQEETVYIIDAHFDTVSDSPGADDNGSGVAGIMEAARVLSTYEFKKSIKFIGFDLEEDGLIGSNWYVNLAGPPDYENTAGVFNFEMIAFYNEEPNSQTLPPGFELLYPDVQATLEADSFRGNFITNVTLTSSAELATVFEDAATTYVPDLKVITIVTPDELVPPDLARSDHARFWEVGIPALLLTDGAEFRNFNYHSPDDEFNSLNFNFLTQVVQTTVAAVAEQAEILHSSSVQTTVNIPTATSNLLDCELRLIVDQAAKEVRILLESCNEAPELVQLWSINGRLITQQALQNTSSLRLSLAGQAPGLYILKLAGANGQWIQKVFVP